jgi:hypothetical protein
LSTAGPIRTDRTNCKKTVFYLTIPTNEDGATAEKAFRLIDGANLSSQTKCLISSLTGGLASRAAPSLTRSRAFLSLSLLIDCPHAFACRPRCLPHTYPTPRLIRLQRKLHIPPPLRSCYGGAIDINGDYFCLYSLFENQRAQQCPRFNLHHALPRCTRRLTCQYSHRCRWHEAHGLRFGFTLDYSANLPSPWAQQVCLPLRHRPFPRPPRLSPLYSTYLSLSRRRNTPCPRT